MLRFVFLAVLASLPVSSISMGLGELLPTNFPDARLGDFQELCKWFCEDHNYQNVFFRTLDDMAQPRIFCGLCKKKLSTTTPQPKTTTSITTTPATSTTSTTTSSTTTPSTTTSSTSPPTTTPTTSPPP